MLKQPEVTNSFPSAPQSLTAGGVAALVPRSTITFLNFEFTSVTELPVSNKAVIFVPFNLTWALGLVSEGGLLAKQQDNTVQKLMIAAGRRDEPLFFFLVGFPNPNRSRSRLIRCRSRCPRRIVHFGASSSSCWTGHPNDGLGLDDPVP